MECKSRSGICLSKDRMVCLGAFDYLLVMWHMKSKKSCFSVVKEQKREEKQEVMLNSCFSFCLSF